MKVITGYQVIWSQPVDIRPPTKLSIEGGIEAIKQWRDQVPMIMLGLRGEATRFIRTIEPVYAFSEYRGRQAIAEGKGKPEDEVMKMLQASISEPTFPVALPSPMHQAQQPILEIE